MLNIYIRGQFNEIFNECKLLLKDLGYSIQEASLNSAYIVATSSLNLLSYGESIEITFKNYNSKIKIEVSSYSRGIQIFDWGKNEENENKIINAIKNRFS